MTSESTKPMLSNETNTEYTTEYFTEYFDNSKDVCGWPSLSCGWPSSAIEVVEDAMDTDDVYTGEWLDRSTHDWSWTHDVCTDLGYDVYEDDDEEEPEYGMEYITEYIDGEEEDITDL